MCNRKRTGEQTWPSRSAESNPWADHHAGSRAALSAACDTPHSSNRTSSAWNNPL